MKQSEEIARVAHELWEMNGRMPGRDVADWLEAERIVMARHKEQTTVMGKKASAKARPKTASRKKKK